MMNTTAQPTRVFAPECFAPDCQYPDMRGHFTGAFEDGEEVRPGVWNKWVRLTWSCGCELSVSEYTMNIYLATDKFYLSTVPVGA